METFGKHNKLNQCAIPEIQIKPRLNQSCPSVVYVLPGFSGGRVSVAMMLTSYVRNATRTHIWCAWNKTFLSGNFHYVTMYVLLPLVMVTHVL